MDQGRRRAVGLTQAELAERARISLHAVSNMERGAARLPHRTTIDLIARALELAPGEHDALHALLRDARSSRGADVALPHARTAPVRFTALPTPLTPLIGRDELLHEVVGALRDGATRLLTLVGSPGVGKSRLALTVAAEMAGAFAGRVAYVPLAAIDDAALVLPAIAQRLGVAEGNDSLLASLTSALVGEALLLVLDNLEQIAEAAPQIGELLACTPGLMVLATSRVPLVLRGECLIVVPPLTLPTVADCEAIDALLAAPAVAVFLASARRAAPSYVFGPSDAGAIAAICRRLDGLPLALELAAPRLRLLSPVALLERLERRLPIAEGGPRDLPRHQRTLRDTVAWSYDRLSVPEQRTFRACAVFASGASLHAVESVTAELHPDGADVRSLLDSLLEKNLLVRDDDGVDGEPRVRLLETLRDFAIDVLRAAGESDAAQRAHAGYFAARIEDDERRVAAKRTWWVARCDEDLPNLRSALQWAMGGDVETGLRISGGLGTYWYLSGRLNEGMRWLRDLLALAGGEQSPVGVAVRAKALYMAGWIACDQGRSRDAVALLDACVALRRRRGSRASLIEALQRLAGASQQYGDLARAERILRACLAYHRRAGDVAATLLTQNALSNVAYERGADAASEDQLREALPIARAHGDASWTVLFLVKLGRFAHARGDCSGANAIFEEGARLACAATAEQPPPLMLLNLAYVARELGRLGEARAYCEMSLARYRSERHEDGVAFASLILGAITVDQGDLRAAGACYAEALSLYERLSVQRALADCFEGIASLKVTSHAQLGAAAMLCGAAARLRDVNGSPLSRREGAEHERTLAALRDLLGADTFLSARATGASLALVDALALARSAAHADEAVAVYAGNAPVDKPVARR